MKTPEQWFQDHYPVPAATLANASDLECLSHCINKWEGYKAENLPKDWVYNDSDLKDEVFGIVSTTGTGSCALCQKYRKHCHHPETKIPCPLKRHNGGTCIEWESLVSETYEASSNDPQPMIDLLKHTLECEKKEPYK